MNDISTNKPLELKNDVNDLFLNLPVEVETVLEFPSRGKFYKTALVKLRPVNFEDEKAMTIAKGQGSNALNILLSRCLIGIDVYDLLIMDKIVATYKLRSISYGNEYKSIAICDSCKAENELNVPLDQLPVNQIDQELQDPRKVILPVLKKEVVVRFPRVREEDFLKDETSIFDNLWRFVESIDGNSNKTIISAFLRDPRLPLRDAHVILNEILGKDLGIQTIIKFNCQTCNKSNITNLPISPDFFTMS